MPETFPEAGSAWRRDGRLEEAWAALRKAQEGARRQPCHEGGWEWPGLREETWGGGAGADMEQWEFV